MTDELPIKLVKWTIFWIVGGAIIDAVFSLAPIPIGLVTIIFIALTVWDILDLSELVEGSFSV
jgi:hypothetical protein